MSEYFLLGTKKFVLEQPTLPKETFCRAPHDIERLNVNIDNFTYLSDSRKGYVRESVIQSNKSLPEVYRFLPFHSVLLTAPLQWLWRNINPELSAEKWSTLMDDTLAWCNQTGIGGDSPRANYVLGKNLDSKPVAFDQVRFCGGAIFKVSISGGTAFIETIQSDNPPSAEFVLNNPHLWYWGTSVSPRGYIYYIKRMGLDGTLKNVRIPLITAQQVYLPLSELHQLPEGIFPPPTWTHYV